MADNYRSIPGAQAGADLSSNQYRALRFDSTARQFVTISNANAQIPIGIQQDDPDTSGHPVDLAYDGVVKAEAGGTIAYGDTLAVNNSGQVIQDAELTDGGASDLHHIGHALEAASSGEIIDILLHNPDRIGSE